MHELTYKQINHLADKLATVTENPNPPGGLSIELMQLSDEDRLAVAHEMDGVKQAIEELGQ